MRIPPTTAGGVVDGEGARVGSIDLLRGLAMVVMVLDHVRDFFTDVRLDPTDLDATTPALFFTRWATHFCAPTFMLLAGVSAALAGPRRSRGERAGHLLRRGLWLVALGQVWENVFLFFTYPHVVLALVLWAIGWSMVALSALVYLPRAAIGVFGVAMIALHNLLDGVPAGGPLWSVLHAPGMRPLAGGVSILVAYPLIPWVGVMASGYALGPLFRGPAGRRRGVLVALGLGSIAGFLVLRSLNLYGDPRPWSARPRPVETAMSFLNCRKYPPSLLYLLMTLGPLFLALAAFDRTPGRADNPLRIFGRVPLSFYLMQWPVAHGLAVAVAALRGYPIGWMFRFPPFQSPPGYGEGLGVVYLFWAISVGILYFPSRWLARRRRR